VPRPLSQLVYARIQEGKGSPRIITLHAHNQFGASVKDYALAACPSARIIGLESYKGVYVGRMVVGYTWFVGPVTRPSPVSFGDALAEIERFLWDEVDRQGKNRAELPFLLGVEQGAIMALAAAAAVPDLLSGVIAVRGCFPMVPGWSPPLVPLDGLPVLLAGDMPEARESDIVLRGDNLAATLERWGAVVTRADAPPGTIPASAMSGWLQQQAIRYRLSDAASGGGQPA
jgi:predicted esterase